MVSSGSHMCRGARPGSWIGFDPAAEMDVVDDFGPRELPRVAERQPVLGIFLLPAVLDHLAEQPVVVADAVAVSGYAEARHAFHEAGGEAAETAIAERRVGLGRAQAIGIDAEVAKRGTRNVGEAEIAEHVGKQAADQELEREIVDALASLRVARAFGREPAMDDTVADGVRGRHEPVAVGGRGGILADRQRQLGEYGTLEFGEFLLGRSSLRKVFGCEFASRTWFCHDSNAHTLSFA